MICSYLREPWTCAVYHDRFSDFVQEIKEYLSLLPHKVSLAHHTLHTLTATPTLYTPSLPRPHTQSNGSQSVEEIVREMVNDESPLTSAQLLTQFNTSQAKGVISEQLFRYLHYNKQHLPMFARPDIV